MKSFLVLLAMLAGTSTLASQATRADESFAVHVRGGLGFLQHTASISSFEGIADCGTYTAGTTLAPQFSLSIERMLTQTLTASAGIRLSNRSTILSAGRTSLPALDVSSQNPANVVFENTINARLSALDIVPELALNVHRGQSSTIRALAGVVFAFPLNARYEITQTIVSPDNAVYTSNKQQSISLSGGERAMNTVTSPLIALSLGAENLLEAGNGNSFSQGIRFEYTLNDIVNSGSWKAAGIRADIGYRFAFTSATPDIPAAAATPPPPPPPPVIVKKMQEPTPLPVLTVRIDSMNARVQTGNELRASLPLVNAVFFDANSASMPDRYIISASSAIQTDNALEHHRNILPEIARIMRENTRASIVLEGATSGADEAGGLNLAKERTENVMAALVSLGIPRERISARTFLTPRIPSNTEYAQGREENRRVDIMVKDAPLQEYVSRQQFAALRGTMLYTVDAQHFNASAIRVTSNLFPEQTHMRSESRTVSFDHRLNAATGMFVATAEANAAPPLTWKAEKEIDLNTLERQIIALDLSSFEAWLRFDYNSSVLSEDNKDLLRQLLRALPQGSTISLLGSADALGDETSNLELSSKRAAVTESFVRSVAGEKFVLETAVSQTKVNETLPEGRFLNRSIRIRVR
jgi:outer membrane protein OmpA-like peptidoglycan-associated protein